MKVLHISSIDITIFLFRIDLLNELKNLGFETFVSSGETFDWVGEGLLEQGHKFEKMNVKKNINPINLLTGIFSVYNRIKKDRIQIVHTHTPIGGFIGRLAAYFAGVPHVMHTTGGWYFHENMSPLKFWIFVQFEKKLAKITDYIFSVNHEDIVSAEKLNIKPRKQIIYSGPSGVNLNKYFKRDPMEIESFKSSLGIDNKTKLVGMVGRLVWEKGYKEFIDTAYKLIHEYDTKNIKFLIVGDGPQENQIKMYVSKIGMEDYIDFLGYRKDVELFINALDLYLFPSHREGVPISLLEAMASEKEVIAFDIRGCREAIDDGLNGHIVPFGDVDKMTNSLHNALMNENIEMGRNARLKIENEYTKEHHVSRQIPVYKKLLEANNKK